jgi:hypothetical protein
MKRRKKKMGHRFKITATRPSPTTTLAEMEPEELTVYVRRAEKKALPIIKAMRLGPGAAQALLAQYAQVLATGDSRITAESMTAVANQVMALWQTGYYKPGPNYPFTFEETLQELREGVRAKQDYADSFQAYTSFGEDIPRGIREISGGIVKHPETNLWQIWMMDEGPWEFLAAYRDPRKAQRNLEEFINTVRHRSPTTTAKALYQQLQAQADGEAKELPYDMMIYLAEHHERYRIKL